MDIKISSTNLYEYIFDFKFEEEVYYKQNEKQYSEFKYL